MKNLNDEEIEIMLAKSKKSLLWLYRMEIKCLRDRGVSFVEIKGWLANQDVLTSVQNIRQFYIRNLNNSILPKSEKNDSVEKVPENSVFQHLHKEIK